MMRWKGVIVGALKALIVNGASPKDLREAMEQGTKRTEICPWLRCGC